MPRRKITIEEAFSVLHNAGIQVQVKSVDTTEQPAPEIIRRPVRPYGYAPVVDEKPHAKFVKITLHARHSVGSGGVSVSGINGRQIEQSTAQTYGPGIGISVPTHIAAHLLHQDMLAQQADDRMLETRQRSYLVVQKSNSSGHIANVGVEVPDHILGNLGQLADSFMHRIG